MFFGEGATLSWYCSDADTYDYIADCYVTDAEAGTVLPEGCDNTCAANGLNDEGKPCGSFVPEEAATEAATDTATEMAQVDSA